MYCNKVEERAVLGLFYKLLQCLHHLHVMSAQVDGKMTKAFGMKLTHLNDFIKPAYAGPQINFHIKNINKLWVQSITNILVSHYNFSISDLLLRISRLRMNSSQTQHAVLLTLQKAARRFGKKLTRQTINQFKRILLSTNSNITTPHNRSGHTKPAVQKIHKHTKNQTANKPQNKSGYSVPQSTLGKRLVRGEADPLSNSFPCNFSYMGQNFKSVEHAYQYEKARFSGLEGLTERIKNCSSASEAIKLGWEVPRSANWESTNFLFMNQLLTLKWDQVPQFRKELMDAKGKDLENPVADVYWGTGTKDTTGLNMFGTLLHNLLKSKMRSPKRPPIPTVIQTPTLIHNRFNVLSTSECDAQTNTPINSCKNISPKKLNLSPTKEPKSSPCKIKTPVDTNLPHTVLPVLVKSLTGPQRPTRISQRNVRKRAPPSPASPIEETSPSCPPPLKRRNASGAGKTTTYFPAPVQTHMIEDGLRKSDWRWPEMEEDILIIGAGNVSSISRSPEKDVQIESFPGARFQHVTDMLKHNTKTSKSPKYIIFNVGFSDRSSDPTKTSCRNLVTMMTWVRTRFPSIKILLAEINYSAMLPQAEQSNINRINKSMAHIEGAIMIPKLDDKYFKTCPNDCTRWREETANAMLSHWLNHLN